MTFALLGLGTAVPATQLSQDDMQKLAFAVGYPSDEQATWLPNMYAHTGIESRNVSFPPDVMRDLLDQTNKTGSVWLPKGTPDDHGPTTGQRMEQYATYAGPLAVRAARTALAQSKLQPTDLTHLVTVSCTGFRAPGVDVELIHRLELPATVQRTHVGYMGCHGALNGLRVARAFADADPSARVLLCAVELCSLHYYYGWDPQKVIANALFADGAAAVVGVQTDVASEDDWQLAASGSCVFPDSVDTMTWTVGDHGFMMTLSRKVPELIRTGLRPFLTQWLAKRRLTLADVKTWAIHPGGPKIVDAAEVALGLDRQATAVSRAVLAEHGNMSSPTLLFILERLRRQRAARPCVALGFGPGLTAEVALFQ